VSAVDDKPSDNAEYPDLPKSKSASLSKSKSASLSKSKSNASASKSSVGSSSAPSSVSSRCSSIATMMKPFFAQENLKRVSVISVESLEIYNKRQSESNYITSPPSKSVNPAIICGDEMDIYNNSETENNTETEKLQSAIPHSNLFKNLHSEVSKIFNILS
jgi:hypothetical protein